MFFAFASESELRISPSEWLGDLEAMVKVWSVHLRPGLEPSLWMDRSVSHEFPDEAVAAVEPDRCRSAESSKSSSLYKSIRTMPKG